MLGRRTLAAFLLTACATSQATQLTYIIEGDIANFLGAQDVFVRFTGNIPSDSPPFAEPPTGVAYNGNSVATVEIIGSPTGDGVYTNINDFPIKIYVRNDKPGDDLLQVLHNGYFDFPDGDSALTYKFTFDFSDPSKTVFSDNAVPNVHVGLEDFSPDPQLTSGNFVTFRDDVAILGSNINITLFRIVPEPATIGLLLLGLAAFGLRRRYLHA